MRCEVEFQGTVSAAVDFALTSVMEHGLQSMKVVMAKVDGSAVSLCCFRSAIIDEHGRVKKAVEEVCLDECRLLAGSMDIVSDYGDLLSGRERRLMASLTDESQEPLGRRSSPCTSPFA